MNLDFNPTAVDLTALPWLPLEDKSAFPSQACIYFAIDSLGAVQYIGRSINARQRWSQHHKYGALSEVGGVKIAYLFVDTPELLPEVEKALIKHFQPPLNVVGRVQTLHIGFRCPDDLVDAIQKEMELTGKDRTTVIVEAMRRGFSLPMDNETEQLKAELNGVKQRLNILEGKLIA